MSVDDQSPLHSFLKSSLPQLGLDYETYGPYITGAIDAGDDDGDDTEELDGVLDLLRSSSETHSDDDEAWSKLREELIKKISEVRRKEEKRKEENLKRARDAEGERAKQARLEAQRYQEELDRAAAEGQQVDAEKKKRIEALVSRYGFEEEGDEEGGSGGGKGDAEGGVDAPQSNRDVAEVAKKAAVQKAREESSKSRESKKTAREATARHKSERLQKKEERKKRAQKGERRR